MTQHIAIVGGGPKGTYGFERLAAQFTAHPPTEPVEIHLFNRTPHFGAGEIYDPDQPDYLLINYAIGNIDMWIDEPPPPVVPRPQPLTAWLRERCGPHITNQDFASRAQVGAYLTAGFRAIIDHLPERVSVRCIVGEVVDLWAEGAGYRLAVDAGAGRQSLPERYRHVLLATGHPRNPPTPIYQEFAERHPSAHFVPFIYPVEPHLTTLPPRRTVAIKGMALTFIDAVLALTEGRGGSFERIAGRLIYRPSGEEPRAIYPFSRSGLPMLPRGPHDGSAPFPLRFFTEGALAQVGAPCDFVTDLWPLLQREMVLAHYRVLFRAHGIELDERRSYEALQAQIDAFHQSHEAERFDPQTFLDPLADGPPMSGEEQHRFILDYLRRSIEAARAGVGHDPLAAVSAVWRLALPLFRQRFEFGGLTPASHRQFMSEFVSPLSRVTFGPPIENTEKMVAVAEAGLLRFDLSRGARLWLDERRGAFCLGTGQREVAVSVFVDARIPKISLRSNRSPLYRKLIQRGLAQPFVNANHTHRYETGGLALSREGWVLDAQGCETRIAMTGTPTEGVVFDNDSLSRYCNNFVSGWAAAVGAEVSNQ